MAKEKVNPSAGVGGSRGGRGRTATAAVYKKAGKKARRAQDKRQARMH